MLKKINYICASSGLMLAIIFYIIKNDEILFLNQLLPALGIYFIIQFCKQKIDYVVLTFFSIWITLYNIIYIVLLITSKIDIYNADYRVKIQLIPPFVIGIICRMIKSRNSE